MTVATAPTATLIAAAEVLKEWKLSTELHRLFDLLQATATVRLPMLLLLVESQPLS